jgi:23S rRNA-/tRNA-specific pseudouridylate synthase
MLFEQHQVRKTYHTIVAGSPPWHEQIVDLPLKVDGDRHHRTVVNPALGKHAWTDLRVLRSSVVHALIEAIPGTGYTHQIRAHLYALGFPILADPLYFIHPTPVSSLIPSNAPIQRLALHAFSISFTHPMTGISLALDATYPSDFQSALEALSLL